MSIPLDLTGQKFNKLTVLEFGYAKQQPSGRIYYFWKCQCECGNIKYVSTKGLRHGGTKSCGCIHPLINGLSHTRLHKIWHGMKRRCYSKTCKNYQHYGEKGVVMCDEWLGDDGFLKFYNWSMANGYSEDLTIDRINPEGNYEPSNCRWATKKQQSNNQRNTKRYEYNGKNLSLGEWADETGISRETLYSRVCRMHWPVERALTQPIKTKE